MGGEFLRLVGTSSSRIHIRGIALSFCNRITTSTLLFNEAGPVQLRSTSSLPGLGRSQRSKAQATNTQISRPAIIKRNLLFQNAGTVHNTPTMMRRKKLLPKPNPKRPAGLQGAATVAGASKRGFT